MDAVAVPSLFGDFGLSPSVVLFSGKPDIEPGVDVLKEVDEELINYDR
ncbi:MAG: hypothetical protein HQ551_04760 [Desulfobacteraceae bacterium]|nr:hypothetical protein [Desulfobacteraceae bacterium]